MIVSYSWLREYVDINVTPEELVEQLTMSGTEAEGIEYLGAETLGVVTGRIESIEAHPTVEKLLICRVVTNLGSSPLGIVTAARNLQVGDTVPVAQVGAHLPGGKRIDLVEFAGATSEGMLVSRQELGLEKESSGIMVLPELTPLGVDIRPLVGLDDWAIDLKVTPNRPDCLCMVGIAREICAMTGASLRPPHTGVLEQGRPASQQVSVSIEDPDLCSRYVARVVNDVKIGPSPEWLQQRLRAVGVRPISNVVDVTNYVMLELNQPLHAFDMDRLAGPGIVVRRAIEGETMETLDGVVRELSPDMLLVCDAEKPVALAGVMGGQNSEVNSDTVNVLLESATFNRVSIWRTSKDAKLRTEASSRFEKGLDPVNAITAVDRAASLIAELASGMVAPGRVDEYPRPAESVSLILRPERVCKMLGVEIACQQMVSILEGLGFGVQTQVSGQLLVEVPSFRKDVTMEADLVEEIGRIYGFDNIPDALPKGSTTMGCVSRAMALEERCISYLVECGLSETLTYAFTNPKVADRLRVPAGSPLRDYIRISNPLTEDFSVMRTLLLGSILEAAERNVSRRASDLGLFECGRVYLKASPMPVERRVLSGLVMGAMGEQGWNRSQTEVDFYDLKGIILGMLSLVGVPEVVLARTDHFVFHPGRCAGIASGDRALGAFGEIHPGVATEYGLPKRAYGFELDLDAVIERATEAVHFSPIPRFPALRRDLAIVVGVGVPAAELEGLVRREAGDMLESIALFDRYMGKQVPEGFQSMAYALTYRATDRTLTDDEVNAVQMRVEGALGAELGARIRS